jgi:hypothetical protein
MIDKVILLFSDRTWSVCDNNKENIADYFFSHHWRRAPMGDKYVMIIELKNNLQSIKRKEDF